MAQSEMLTHDGYPAVQLENGSHMTEYSITVTDPRLNNGRPTNIPSLWERKVVDQDTAVDKALQSKKEYKSFDTIKEAVSDSERKSNAGGANAPEEYNKGGAVRNLLATGGVMQEGGTKDPVSGNDVPAGALKEEVRDDIDAKLSAGEFVFPADVTRYIGLDKLMQIRDAAKEGLKDMENKGQMGNSEQVADDAVGEDKFSSHIDEIMAGLEGGGGEPKKFAVGGAVNTSDYSAAPIKGFKMVQYEDVQTKTVKYIPFVNGKALLPIPKGYTEKKVETPATPVAPATPVVDAASATRAGGGGGSGAGQRPETEGAGVDVEAGDTGIEGFGDVQSGTNPNIGRVAGAVAGLVNPFVGLLVGAAAAYSINKTNKTMATANAQAISFSALQDVGFEAKDIAAAQEAAAKATMEGKSAKEVAVAAANAATLSADPNSPSKSFGGYYAPKTSLDALIGITNGWNTAKPEAMKADAMPNSLKEKVPVGTWDTVVAGIKDGLTPEQAVDKAINVMDVSVGSYFTNTKMTDKEAEARITASSEALGGVPAGKYSDVVKDVKDGMSVKDAIEKANFEVGNEPSFMETGNQDPSVSDRNMAAERAAREAKNQQEKDRETSRQEAAAREATNQANLNAARDATDRAEAAQRAATEAAKREGEYAAERAAADRQTDSEGKSERASQFGGQQTANPNGSYSNSLTSFSGGDSGP
jgi:hypothetical protein